MNPRQRRGLALLVVSVLGSGAVFAALSSYTATVARRIGPTRPVLVPARDIPAFQQLTPSDLRIREIPQMYAADAELASFDDIAGRVPAVPLTAGAPLQDGVLVEVPQAHSGERELTVPVGVEDSVAVALAPLDRVDVVAAYRSRGGQAARATVAVSGARVLRVEAVSSSAGLSDDQQMSVTLALTPKQVQAVALAQTVSDGLRLALQPRGTEPEES